MNSRARTPIELTPEEVLDSRSDRVVIVGTVLFLVALLLVLAAPRLVRVIGCPIDSDQVAWGDTR